MVDAIFGHKSVRIKHEIDIFWIHKVPGKKNV